MLADQLDFRDTNDDNDENLTAAEDFNSNDNWADDFTQGGSTVNIPDYLFRGDFDRMAYLTKTTSTRQRRYCGYSRRRWYRLRLLCRCEWRGTPNYQDKNDATTGFPSFVDVNSDGINDKYDFDLDGLPDFFDLDSDNDGITDLVEAGGADADTNGLVDNFTDGTDGAANGLDDNIAAAPLADGDFDNDGLKNRRDLDSDNDGITDNREAQGSNYVLPANADADGDGIDNAYDNDFGTLVALVPVNSDAAGLADYTLYLYSDNDQGT